MFSSMVIDPMLSATIRPDVGFLMFVMAPRMSALSVEYSNARSQSASKVQFSNIRSCA